MRLLGVLVLLAALGALGCMANPVPLSAQVGSTVVIPLGHSDEVGTVGFGGLAVNDPQRGELVYSLDTASGPIELVTRGTTLIGTTPPTPIARGEADNFGPYQVVSLVDLVPRDEAEVLPLGTYDVSVERRFTDPVTGTETEEVPVTYQFQLSVLPGQIEVVDDAGFMETVTGSVTPFEAWNAFSGSPADVTGHIPDTMPDPTVRLALDSGVWAVELAVTYPAAVITVRDAFETPSKTLNHTAATWIDDDGAGDLTVSATAQRSAFGSLSVAFTLDDPSTAILDPADVSVGVVKAWDKDGNEISASASVAGIF